MGGIGWFGWFGSFREAVGVGKVQVAGRLAVFLPRPVYGEAVHVQGVSVAEKLLTELSDLALGAVLVGWIAGNSNGVKLAHFRQFGRNKRKAKAVFLFNCQGHGSQPTQRRIADTFLRGFVAVHKRRTTDKLADYPVKCLAPFAEVVSAVLSRPLKNG